MIGVALAGIGGWMATVEPEIIATLSAFAIGIFMSVSILTVISAFLGIYLVDDYFSNVNGVRRSKSAYITYMLLTLFILGCTLSAGIIFLVHKNDWVNFNSN